MIDHSTREKITLLLLAGALLLCHGVFGSLHLLCASPGCSDGVRHAAEHHSAVGTAGDTHEHPTGHATSTEYFAVVAGLLGLLVSLLSKGRWLEIWLGLRRAAVLRWAVAVFRPPRAPTSPVLQVFRL
ncbi:MAG: hypothetical protein M3454_04710 [Actinomycetota bacterium]|nr:hypothetical protein [Actinomycetota bacterium]